MKPFKPDQTKALLDKLIELAGRQAHTILIGTKQELVPTFVLVSPQGMRLCACQWGDDAEKEAVIRQIRQQIAQHQVFAYSFLCEAWGIVRDKWDWGPNEPVPEAERPKEQADRQEIVMVVAASRDGSRRLNRWQILRDPLGKCYALREEQTSRDDQEQPVQWQSWMDNLFT